MKQLIILLISTLLLSCIFDDRKEDVLKTDKDFVEFWRQPSPDGSMLLLNYGLDLGALGYGSAGTAVLKVSDTTKNLRQFTLPNTLILLKWINNKNVDAQFDIIPSIRSGEHLALKDTEMNGVRVKVSPYDGIVDNSRLKIECRKTSSDGIHELVAYRYINNTNNISFIHVSVIPKGGQIPKYGNYLIAGKHSDYALDGAWEKNSKIVFYSNSQYANMVQYYLVRNRPNIDYRIINDDKNYVSKYLWIGQSSK